MSWSLELAPPQAERSNRLVQAFDAAWIIANDKIEAGVFVGWMVNRLETDVLTLCDQLDGRTN